MFYKNKLRKVCEKYCPLECDSVSYTLLENSFRLNDSLTGFNVYFRSLQYTLITQDPKMTIFDLFSNIGGLLGLFVGLSFASLFEIIELLIQIGLILVKRYRENKQPKSIEAISK